MVNAGGAVELRYVRDDEPGLRRRARRRFAYTDEATGERVSSERVLERIRRLAIPPAWCQVWICADPLGYLQATGRDDRGRKQYRYHPVYRALREQEKFADLIPFGEALGDLRSRVERDLVARGLGAERVIALVITLLDRTAIRIGNQAYARDNRTFGLTTLRPPRPCLRFNGVVRLLGQGQPRSRRAAAPCCPPPRPPAWPGSRAQPTEDAP
jgi:DNA topoisomerase I